MGLSSQATSLAGIQPYGLTILGVANTRIGGLHICRSKIGGVLYEGKR